MTLKNILSKPVAAGCTVGLILLAGVMYPQSTPQRRSRPAPRAVTDRELLEPDPADWLMWRRTLNSWGYSPLNQIDKSNAGRLQLVWTRGMGPGIQEATPLVRDGVMFLPNPSDYIQALDAATGDLRWEYKRNLPEDLSKFLPVPSINRNLAIYGNQIIDTSADDFLFALDTMTGKLAWETRIVDYRETPAQETSGPIIANGKIFSTRGCEYKFSPDGCIITAHDAKTGKELWRRRTIPKPGEPGDESWGGIPDRERRHVGAWMVPSYDAEFNLLYVGTSVTSPAPKFLLAGNDKEYLYHNSTLAIDGDTGRIVWYYQHVVDHWDFDHPFERLLVDTAVAPDASEVDLDQSAASAGRAPQGDHRNSRQDRHRLYTGPSDGRVSVGTPHRSAKRGGEDRWSNGQGHGESGNHFQCRRRNALRLSQHQRRQGFPGRCIQSDDQRNVLRSAEHCAPTRPRSTRARCMPSTHGPRSRPGPRTSEPCLRFPRRPARLCGATTSVRA